MATVLAGMLVMTTFLLTSVMMFGTFLSTSVSQGESLKALAGVSIKRLGSRPYDNERIRCYPGWARCGGAGGQ